MSAHSVPELIVAAVPAAAWIIAAIVSIKALSLPRPLWGRAARAVAVAFVVTGLTVCAMLFISN